MVVVKRDGRRVDFNPERITGAILKAFKAVYGEISPYAEDKAQNIVAYISGLPDKELTVEQIQDYVEHGLMTLKNKKVARAYISYRDERTRTRTERLELMKLISEKINASNTEQSNANMDEHSFGGRRGEATNTLMRQYALDYLISKKARFNHINNRIYIHDLDSYPVGMHNCLSILFDDLLANGFNTRQTDVRPANSINTAFQLVAVIFQLQSLQQFGGCSATHLDWTMVPYVRKSFFKHYMDGWHFFLPFVKTPQGTFMDVTATPINSEIYRVSEYSNIGQNEVDKIYNYAMEMTERELQQAVEGMYHNLNTLQSRSGN